MVHMGTLKGYALIHYFPRRLYLKELAVGLFLALLGYLLITAIKIENPYLSILTKVSIQTILIFAQIKLVLLSNFKAVMNPDPPS